jgi:hypothetical protein
MNRIKTDSPFAMVRVGSKEAKSLEAIGWIVTDRYTGWLHMEPPLK